MKLLFLAVLCCCSGCDTNSDPVLVPSTIGFTMFSLFIASVALHAVRSTEVGTRQSKLQDLECGAAIACFVQCFDSVLCYAWTQSLLAALACASIALLFLFVAQLTRTFLVSTD